MSTSLQWEAPAAGIRLFLSKATITGSSFAAGCMRNLLPGSAPCNDSACTYKFSVNVFV